MKHYALLNKTMNTLELTLHRKWKKDNYTIGNLYIDDEFFCNTLEDKDRNLFQGMSKSDIEKRKVYSKTAIPYGRYRITLKVQSPKYSKKKQYEKCNGYLPRLLNVPCFEGVLLHIGNFPQDSAGCILLGKNEIKGAVVNSTTYFWKLYDILKKADDEGKQIWITIQQ